MPLMSWTTIIQHRFKTPFPCIQTTTSVQQGVSVKTRSYTVRFTLHSSISVTSSWLRILCALKISQTRSKKFSPKNKKDLGMACHTPPLKKVKKQGEMPLPSLSPIMIWLLAVCKYRGGKSRAVTSSRQSVHTHAWEAVPNSNNSHFMLNCHWYREWWTVLMLPS